MNLSKFYEEKSRLSYNPRERLLFKRTGLKKLISFDDRFLEVSKALNKLIKAFKKDKVKILDIGIGDGVYESLIDRSLIDKTEIYGIDMSVSQLARSKKFVEEGKVVDLNEQKVPYQDNFFDIVIVSELLEHLFFPEKVLSEAWRVLDKDGCMLITYPNSGSLQLRASLLFRGSSPLLNYPRNKEHIRFFNKEDIVSMFVAKPKTIFFQGLGSLLFAKWNFPAKIPTPRILQILGNKYLPDFALGQMLIIKK